MDKPGVLISIGELQQNPQSYSQDLQKYICLYFVACREPPGHGTKRWRALRGIWKGRISTSEDNRVRDGRNHGFRQKVVFFYTFGFSAYLFYHLNCNDYRYAAQGAQGMVTYNIKGSKHPIRFAIAFSVPFSYKLSRNWYGLKVIDDDQSLNQKYFLKLYKKDFYDHSLTNEFSFVSETQKYHAWSPTGLHSFKRLIQISLQAKRDGKIKIERDPYTITATMTEGKRAVLRVKVTKKGESD